MRCLRSANGIAHTIVAGHRLYLAEKAGQVSASDLRARTEVARWIIAAISTLEAPLLQIVTLDQKALDPKNAAVVAAIRPDLVAEAHRYLGVLDRWLEGRRFVTGDDFTVADIAMATVLRDATKNELLERHPRVNSYRTLCEARPAWARALAGYETRLGVNPGDARNLAGIVGPHHGGDDRSATTGTS